MQPTTGRTRTSLLRPTGTAGLTSEAGLASASGPPLRLNSRRPITSIRRRGDSNIPQTTPAYRPTRKLPLLRQLIARRSRHAYSDIPMREHRCHLFRFPLSDTPNDPGLPQVFYGPGLSFLSTEGYDTLSSRRAVANAIANVRAGAEQGHALTPSSTHANRNSQGLEWIGTTSSSRLLAGVSRYVQERPHLRLEQPRLTRLALLHALD